MSKILANQIANYGDDAPIEIKEGLNIPAGKPIQAAGSAGSSGQVLSTTGASIQWVTTFDGDYNTLTNKPNIPSAQVNSDWNATGGVAVILNKPVVPAQPSVTTAAAGTAALSYNSTNGEFTFTPPDLANQSNWDTAYGWGNHASAGYLTSYSEADTLDTVLSRGATTTRDITTTGKLYYSNNFATTGDLPSATTYHGMFAHVHGENHGYFAHAGAWTQLLDTGSSLGELADVNFATAPQSGQVLKYDGSNWVAGAGGGGGGIALTDLSVSTASAGTAALSYNNVSGVFSYTPPDLSSYAQTANLNISNWNLAYSWSNHAGAGYLTSVDIAGKNNWDTAYGWGDHSQAGYLTSASADTLDSVTGRGAVTTNNIQVNKVHSDTILAAGPTAGDGSTGTYVSMEWDGGSAYRNMNFKSTNGGGTTTMMTLNANGGTVSTTYLFTAGSLTASGTAPKLSIYNAPSTGYAEFTYTAASVAAYTLPELPSSSGDVLSCTTGGVMSWVTPASGGGGGANVTISDTIPAGTPTAGDLWWESDTGRLKVYYTDVDSSQWIDASPPLTQDRIATSSAPSSATDTGTPGDIRYDSGYVYICISNNTWKRAALTTW